MNPFNLFRLLSLGLLAVTEVLAASVAGISGQSANFTASASGTAPFSYQWYKNGAAISGATANTYAISSLSVSDTGDYSVQVSNSVGSATSAITSLSVTAPMIAPAISSPPAGLSVVSGKAASFSVTATGTAPFAYQWYKNNVAISGATTASYSIATVNTGYAGSYTVKVSNSAGSVTSSAAVLVVLVKPSISTQPATQTVASGKAVAFSVAATGTAPFTYQWYKNSVAISGATSSSYSIAAVSTSNAGSYMVKVTNSAGTASSSTATLTVALVPTISTQPASVVANLGKPASFSVVASGTAPFTYQWYKNGTAITGATLATYSLATADAASAGAYSVLVSNVVGSVKSSAATLSVIAPPVIVTQPMSLTIHEGKSASFTVLASSSVAMSYQWCRNGVALAGATSASLAIPVTSSTNAGSYTVIVSNAAGSVSSTAVNLTVTAAPTYNRMCTISVRTVVDAANASSVIGFVTEGNGTRRFLVRGVGPGLADYGVNSFLARPKVEVHSKVAGVETLIASNLSWGSEAKAAQAFIEAGAFPLAEGSADAAAVIEVPAGSYTVTLTGVSGSTGVALVEIYELP